MKEKGEKRLYFNFFLFIMIINVFHILVIIILLALTKYLHFAKELTFMSHISICVSALFENGSCRINATELMCLFKSVL